MDAAPPHLRPRNRHGTPVDPVPFLVVALLAFTVSFSYGPIYFRALGLSISAGLLASGALTALAAVLAYHRYVWTARPDLRAEIPVDLRLKRLVYGVVIGILAAVVLSLPLLPI